MATKTKTKTPEKTSDESPVDIGDAAATGSFAYAGEKSEDAAPVDDPPGTKKHLGDSPYAGSLEP